MMPDTEGWRKLNERRFHQIEHIKDRDDRYQGWLVAAISAYVQQNFTETGWGLTRGPEAMVDRSCCAKKSRREYQKLDWNQTLMWWKEMHHSLSINQS
jgi:hypothetical protein